MTPTPVNDPLTPDRPRRRHRSVECHDFNAALQRMLRAYGRRVAGADVEDLAELVALADVLDDVIADAIAELRGHQEFSWATIGEAAGITRQGAQQRWGRRRSQRSTIKRRPTP